MANEMDSSAGATIQGILSDWRQTLTSKREDSQESQCQHCHSIVGLEGTREATAGGHGGGLKQKRKAIDAAVLVVDQADASSTTFCPSNLDQGIRP